MKYQPGPLQKVREVEVADGVFIDDFVNLYECSLGANTRVGSFVEIGKGVSVGARCRLGRHAYICPGVTIEDEVVIGDRVNFINDPSPRSTNQDGSLQTAADWKLLPTLIKRGASIGSRSVIMCDITVGEGALVRPGSVVTKNVPPRAIVEGSPARIVTE